MSCHVMSCHVMSCLSSRVSSPLCRVVSCRVMSCRVVPCRVVLWGVVSCRVVSCRVVSCRVVSCRVVSCRVALIQRGICAILLALTRVTFICEVQTELIPSFSRTKKVRVRLLYLVAEYFVSISCVVLCRVVSSYLKLSRVIGFFGCCHPFRLMSCCVGSVDTSHESLTTVMSLVFDPCALVVDQNRR